MLKKHHFQTPADLLQTLESCVRDRMARLGRFEVHHLTAVRDYARWLQPVGRSLRNGFQTRRGIETAHSFCYKPRALTPERRAAGDSWGAFCTVKAHVRDVHLSQDRCCRAVVWEKVSTSVSIRCSGRFCVEFPQIDSISMRIRPLRIPSEQTDLRQEPLLVLTPADVARVEHYCPQVGASRLVRS